MSSLFRLVVVKAVLALALALPAQAREGAAAIIWRHFDTTVESEDGARRDMRFRRIGIEYWEGVAPQVQMGFSLGYSENEAPALEGVRPVEAASGNFASLGLRFQIPLTVLFSLEGGADYLLQRDVRDTGDFEFQVRSWETRAELAAIARYRNVFTGAGASWRDIDLRETLQRGGEENVRRSVHVDDTGAFFVLGLQTDPSGSVAFRYDTGAEEGWSLRFQRTF
jgi:hypothetical protein